MGKSANVSRKEEGRVRRCSMFLLPRGNVFEEWSNVKRPGYIVLELSKGLKSQQETEAASQAMWPGSEGREKIGVAFGEAPGA